MIHMNAKEEQAFIDKLADTIGTYLFDKAEPYADPRDGGSRALMIVLRASAQAMEKLMMASACLKEQHEPGAGAEYLAGAYDALKKDALENFNSNYETIQKLAEKHRREDAENA